MCNVRITWIYGNRENKNSQEIWKVRRELLVKRLKTWNWLFRDNSPTKPKKPHEIFMHATSQQHTIKSEINITSVGEKNPINFVSNKLQHLRPKVYFLNTFTFIGWLSKFE